MTRAETLAVGDEILSGQIADTNAAYLSRRLGELGIAVTAHHAIGDEQAGIETAVREAADKSLSRPGRGEGEGQFILIVTGGLGPTHDDVTREAVAAAAGAELVLDTPSLADIRARFKARGIDMPPSNEKQAAIPRGADVLPNPVGTAPGFRVRIGQAFVFVLPGVPGEMKAMFEAAVLPLLPKGEGVIASRVLNCFGMAESAIAELLGAHIDLHGDPRVAFLPVEGIIHVKFTAHAASRVAALARIAPAADRAHQLLGDVVFGEDDDSLEDAVVSLLERHNKTLAVAESCTGGLLADRLTDVSGISRCFLEGLVTYSNEAKTRLLGIPAPLFDTVGAVSEEVARLMAEGVRSRSHADFGVGITGIAGPTGGTPDKPVGTVHIAVASAARTMHRHLTLLGSRRQVKDRAAKYALNMLRLEPLSIR